jgi:hypothetical protein
MDASEANEGRSAARALRLRELDSRELVITASDDALHRRFAIYQRP